MIRDGEMDRMLALTLKDFMIEIKEGAIKNIGAPTKAASAKLYDITRVEARAFGDDRVKLVFEDGEGNEVQAAVFPSDASTIRREIEALERDSAIFE